MRLRRYPVVLAYHRVAPELDTRTPTVTPATFERHMRYVAKRFRVMTFGDAVRHFLVHDVWPARTAVITFDDGDAVTHTHAWPILRRYRVPATVFMIAGNVEQPAWLSRQQMTEMVSDGIEIGSHTVHHAYLPSLEPTGVHDELRVSKQMLEALVGHTIDTMSYPGGGFSSAIVEAVRETGYLAACTTNRVLEQNGTAHQVGRWSVRRIKMTERSSAPWVLRAKLSGYYDTFRRLSPSH